MKEISEKEISELLSLSAHQLCAPLAGIKGYLSMLLEGDFGKLNKKQESAVSRVLSSAERLIRIVDTFLNGSVPKSKPFFLNITNFALERLAEKAVQELNILARQKGVAIDVKYDRTSDFNISADEDKLHLVITNLLDNAVKYTDKGFIKVCLEKEDGVIRLSVKDSGIGIDRKDLKKIFNKFLRGKPSGGTYVKGSGLGLYVAQRIVKAHKGRIWAQSEGRGKGTVFILELKQK